MAVLVNLKNKTQDKQDERAVLLFHGKQYHIDIPLARAIYPRQLGVEAVLYTIIAWRTLRDTARPCRRRRQYLVEEGQNSRTKHGETVLCKVIEINTIKSIPHKAPTMDMHRAEVFDTPVVKGSLEGHDQGSNSEESSLRDQI